MVGRNLAHYEIQERIGAGGMGVVYRAHDTRLRRMVAIKLLGEEMPADETARARLLQEARTASALNHPNICTIYEVGEADGHSYIAMEFVEGRPLSALIPHDGLPASTLFRYAIQIAEAIGHAHERGILHRDLKSSNVMVTPAGRAKVLDFGLAMKLDEPRADAPTRTEGPLTGSGALAGTLSHMSPEVLQGATADTRSDLWAVGVMLYEMTCGMKLFQGRTAFALTSAILKESPRPLPDFAPAGMQEIIDRCLVKEPVERYQSAGEIRAALEALQSSTTRAPVASVERGRSWSRRNWVWAVLPAGTLAIGGYWVYGRKYLESSGPRLSTGGVASKHREANEYFEKGMMFLTTQYDLPRARQMLERALEMDPGFTEARAWYGLSHLLQVDGGFSNDTGWIYRAEEDIRRALEENPECATAHSTLAGIYFYQGRKDLIPAQAARAMKLNPGNLDAVQWQAMYHAMSGDYASGKALLKVLLDRNPLFGPARFNLGDILRQEGDLAGSIREQEKVLELDPQNAYALMSLAQIYMERGDLSEARRSLERIRVEERQKNYQVRLLLAMMLALEGRRDDALVAMDAQVLKYAELSPYIASWAAEFYSVLADEEKALAWLERSVRLGDERIAWFRRNPFLANIRRNPRFSQILESIAQRRKQG